MAGFARYRPLALALVAINAQFVSLVLVESSDFTRGLFVTGFTVLEKVLMLLVVKLDIPVFCGKCNGVMMCASHSSSEENKRKYSYKSLHSFHLL
jgi:hypothetical protein